MNLKTLKLIIQIFLKNRRAKKLIDKTDRYDNTPLHVAASEGHLQIVKVLEIYRKSL